MNIVIYLAFLIFYIVTFYFIYNKNAELVSFIFLFVLNALFLAYVLNETFGFFRDAGLNNNPIVSYLVFFSVCGGLFMEFVGLLLVIITYYYMKTNYQKLSGNPLYLSPAYKTLLNEFKKKYIFIFTFSYVLLFSFIFYADKIKRTPFKMGKTFGIYLVCGLIAAASYYMICNANDYSELRQKNFLASPVKTRGDLGSSPSDSPPDSSLTGASVKVADFSVINNPYTVPDYVRHPPTIDSSENLPVLTTPAPTESVDVNKANYAALQHLLTESTLEYSDYCNLNYEDHQQLMTDSKLSYSYKSKFGSIYKNCSGKTTDRNPHSNVAVQVASKISASKDALKESASTGQSQYLAENA
jgi:hypothetical protein